MRDAYLDGPVEQDREALWRTRLSSNIDDTLTLVLDTPDRLLGFVCVLRATDAVYGSLIDNLHVAPGFMGHGFGRRLLRAAAESLLASGQNYPLHLWVFDQNISACRFYELIGGTVAGKALQREPDGSAVVSVRYLWRSPHDLIEAIAATSGDRAERTVPANQPDRQPRTKN